MEKLEQLENIVEMETIGTLKTFTNKTERKVSALLNKLKLNDKYFAILIDGKKAKLTDVIKEGSSIILLPKIAGGN